jgi:hypothetical protein
MSRLRCRRTATALALGVVLSAAAIGVPAWAAKKGEVCGGIVGVACDMGLYCDYPPGKCQVADLSGRCEKAPEVCTALYNPVCDCDGKEHGNDCLRKLKRARKAHDGLCRNASDGSAH